MRTHALVVIVVLMAGCSPAALSPTSTPPPSVAPSEEQPPFAAAAQAFLRFTCTQPTTMESSFCTDVDVDGLTVEGDTLTVPTSASGTNRLSTICEDIAASDLQATATAEGVMNIVVAGESGEQAECEFPPPPS